MESKLLLKNWNLPECVLQQYTKNGLTSMFHWQAECLSIEGVLDGRNLVYAAPTSAGKTLVVEILLLKRVLETGKKALFILPFISVAREKLFHMRRLFEETGIRVDGYMGGHAPTNGFASVDVAVCTIEKANGLINRLIEEKNIDQIGLLVVDELHMVGDEGRGYILELLLTKIRFMSKERGDSVHEKQKTNIQIVGMSATLPNLELLADWLDAAVYVTEFRPVPLQRCLKVGTAIISENLEKLRDFTPAFNSKNDEDNVAALCYETLNEGNSVLLFCPTKNWCEKLADNIARQFYDLNREHQKDGHLPSVTLKFDELKNIFEQLSNSPVGVDAILNRTIPLGVAYHHAGLTTEERDIVESGFRIGAIRVLVATSTLSSGVNLPARRVIIRSPTFNRKTLDVRTYLQMTGRAGRKGVDEEGESILICRQSEQSRGKSLLTAKPQPIKSCLIQANDEELTSSMKRAILEIIVNGIASTYESVKAYTDCTLLSSQLRNQTSMKFNGPITRRRSSLSPSPSASRDPGVGRNVIENCIAWLVEHEFIHIQEQETTDAEGELENESKRYIIATQLGRAALLSSLPTSDALTVLADLNQAIKALALDTELHLIYLVTPIFCYNEWTGLDWYQYLNVYESLSSSYKNAAKLIGVNEQFLTRMASGGASSVPRKGRQAERIQRMLGTHRRFYAALALHDLVQEVPLPTVCSKYSCNRGMLQQLQQSAASFAGMVTTFCQELGWWSLEVLLREFQTRLAFGVQRELMDLMQISLLNSQRARALYSAGMTSCKSVAISGPTHVELVLRNSVHFQTTRKTVNEAEWEIEERKKQRIIHVTGMKGLTEHEAAALIVDEAKAICGCEDTETQKTISNNGQCLSQTKLSQSTSKEKQYKHVEEPKDNIEIPLESKTANKFVNTEPKTPMNDRMKQDKESNSISNSGNEQTLEIKDNCEMEEVKDPIKESSLTETQMKLVLDDESMEFSFSMDTEKDINDFKTVDNHYQEDGGQQETAEEPEIFLKENDEGNCSEISNNTSTSNSPITLKLDQHSFNESDELLSDEDIMSSANIPVPTFSNPESNYKDIPSLHSQTPSNTISEEPHRINGISSPNTAISTSLTRNETAKTSLTESQLNVLMDDSFSQDMVNTEGRFPKAKEINGIKAECDGNYNSPNPTKILQSHGSYHDSPNLSPATLKAMDMSFSPCLFENETSGEETAAKTIKILTRNVSVALERLSTPTHENGDKFQVKIPHLFATVNGESPFLSAGQKSMNKSSNPFYKEERVLGITVTNPPENDSAGDNSLEDLFNPSSASEVEEDKNLTNHNSTGFSSESLGELDRALNLSVLSSDFSDSGTPPTVKQIEKKPQKSCETRKRKLPGDSCLRDDQYKKTTKNKNELLTPPKCSSMDDFADQLILSSQKENPSERLKSHKKCMRFSKSEKRQKLSKNLEKLINLPNSLKDLTNTPSEDESVIVSSQTNPVISQLSQKLTASQSGLTIIDVCSHAELFKMFLDEFGTKSYFSFAVAARGGQTSAKTRIGLPTANGAATPDQQFTLENKDSLAVVGIAICWGQHDAYYVSFEKFEERRNSPDERFYEESNEFSSLKPPPLSEDLSAEKRINSVKTLASSMCQKSCVGVGFGIKKQFKALLNATGISLDMNWQDPSVAAWMLDPTGSEKTLIASVNQFIADDIHLLTGLNKCSNYGSISCSGRNDMHAPARIRACAEAVSSYRLMKRLKQELNAVNMWKTFTSVEMPHILSLSFLELNGIGFDAEGCSQKIVELHDMMRELEKEAHRLAKRKFTLSSPNEVAKVLYSDLGLIPDGLEAKESMVDMHKITTGCPGSWRKGSKRGGEIPRSWSTKKEVLEKLKHLHPLPEIIMNWRQISFTLSKVIHPFSRICVPCSQSRMNRIHSECIVKTVTGRVSVIEPNIQNVPKSFTVRPVGGCQKGDRATEKDICVRNLFIPAKGHVYLAADYSQLELRIFAHFSNDAKLLKILNCDTGDVFKMIAAQWKDVPVDLVSSEDRQRAKQICYGMLYGIGPRALSEQLNVDEKAAEQFMESFMRSFPNVRSYIRNLVQKCSDKGYVETILGRRRYLPTIKDSNMSIRSQAERQAVNTTVQGSAADLVKKATVKIMKRIGLKYNTLYCKSLQTKSASWRKRVIPGCYFVLHLHDELMFEVQENNLPQIATLVRTCMEQAIRLKVRLPVKLSTGSSWGQLRDYNPT